MNQEERKAPRGRAAAKKCSTAWRAGEGVGRPPAPLPPSPSPGDPSGSHGKKTFHTTDWPRLGRRSTRGCQEGAGV